jgi:hypothetical protein
MTVATRDNTNDPTNYAVVCNDECGLQFLSEEDYNRQMDRPDAFWRCPKCGGQAEWDDECRETNPSPDPLSCMDCGLPYSMFSVDSTLPDEQWRMIHDSEGGLLCAQCMVERASKLPGVVAVRMRIDFGEDKCK